MQPNAIDLRIAKIIKNDDTTLFTISDEFKEHRGKTTIVPEGGWYELEPGTYEIVAEGTVTIANGEAGFVIPRSSFNRNGIFVTSGLYDSGYSGVMAGCMHLRGPARIAVGTRFGQFLTFQAETYGLYNGSYGATSEHDKKAY